MKAFLVLALVALAQAEAPGYNYPSAPSQGYGSPGGSIGVRDFGDSNIGVSGNIGGNTYRHVYVHVAPDEPLDEQARVIRVPGNQNKHVNIIFVKAPSNSASQQTEVILPEQDEQKTIVYVLNRKFDPTTDLKIRAPRPKSPTKPDVYFIRYKDQQQGGQVGGQIGGGPSSAPVYGAPF